MDSQAPVYGILLERVADGKHVAHATIPVSVPGQSTPMCGASALIFEEATITPLRMETRWLRWPDDLNDWERCPACPA